MTDTQNQSQHDSDDLPEPPIYDLYELYLDSLEYGKSKWLGEFEKLRNLPESLREEILDGVSRTYDPMPIERFKDHLDKHEEQGTREVFVNKLILGPAYADSHPYDPRISDSRIESFGKSKSFKDRLGDDDDLEQNFGYGR